MLTGNNVEGNQLSQELMVESCPRNSYYLQSEEQGMNVGIACGGTGGHIFPGLAVAKVLRDRRHDVAIWLSGSKVEAVSTANWSGPVVFVGGRGLPSGFSMQSVPAVMSLLMAFARSWFRMKRNPPDVLLAMGGYGSVGPVLAAHFLGIPVVLHEANAIPGRAIEKLSKYASVVAISFESSAAYIRHRKIVLTGFPVRPDIRNGSKEGILKTGLFTVLVMGGSQGAHRINEVAAAALCHLHLSGIPVQVIHLAGANDEAVVRKAYEQAGVPCAVLSFLGDMAKAYNQADIAIARAGAATCAELVARTVPAILVPLPTAMRDHQTANARSLEKSGGVEVMIEREFTVERLSEYVRECYRNPEKLDSMRESLNKNPMNYAAEKIAEVLEKIAGRNKS